MSPSPLGQISRCHTKAKAIACSGAAVLTGFASAAQRCTPSTT
jgi:hypothetical protein